MVQRDEGFEGAWFAGRVIDHEYPDKIVVEYDELRDVDSEVEDGDPQPYVSTESLRFARPIPPPEQAGKAAKDEWLAGVQPGVRPPTLPWETGARPDSP